MKSKLVVAAAFLALWACASTPDINYFTLDMSPSGKVENALGFLVERFSTTESLSQSRILIQESPTRIEYYATDRWSSGIGELVQQKLAAELGPVAEGQRAFRVSGRVVAFEQVDGAAGAIGRTRLEVQIRDAQQKRYEEALLEKTYEATHAADAANADAVAVALSRATEAIAAEIAADVSRLEGSSS